MQTTELIDSKLQTIRRARKQAELDLLHSNAESRRLRVVQNHGTWQYYVIEQKGDSNGKYLPVAQRKTAREIAQRDYAKRVLSITSSWEENLLTAQELLKSIPDDPMAILQEPSFLHPGKAPLITPYGMSNEEFATVWQQKPFLTKGIPDTVPALITNRGEKVRSKSEKIIADRLAALQIPYRYEAPLILKNGKRVYPDFTILDVARRREVILEHLGLLTDYRYSQQNVEKINWYAESGYVQGKTIFFTYECDGHPLSKAQLDAIISQF